MVSLDIAVIGQKIFALIFINCCAIQTQTLKWNELGSIVPSPNIPQSLLLSAEGDLVPKDIWLGPKYPLPSKRHHSHLDHISPEEVNFVHHFNLERLSHTQIVNTGSFALSVIILHRTGACTHMASQMCCM